MPNYFDPQTLAKFKNLSLRARHVVEGYLAGAHRSPANGFSIEFSEHREYTPGDDLRYVDWKVFGRTDKFYLKRFEDETNLTCHLVVDVSESMSYQGPLSSWSKYDCAATLAASLAWLVLKQQDAVGLCCFDERIREWIRPQSDGAHYHQVLRGLDIPKGNAKTSMRRVLHDLASRLRRRGLVILFSDCFDDIEDFVRGLQHLRYCRHQVILAHALDAAELEFPFHQQTLFRGLEGLPNLLVNPGGMRNAYLRRIQGFLDQLQARCREMQIEYLLLRNDQSLDYALTQFLVRRGVGRWRNSS